MTIKKAKQEFRWMLEETAASERLATADQKHLGDACRELREAYDIPRNAIAAALRVDSMAVAELERRCSTVQARRYRAVMNLVRTTFKPAKTAKKHA